PRGRVISASSRRRPSRCPVGRYASPRPGYARQFSAGTAYPANHRLRGIPHWPAAARDLRAVGDTMSKKKHVTLGIEALESRVLLSTTTTSVILAQQNFDHTTVGTLPAGWSQWSSQGAFGGTASGFDGSPGMAATGTSSVVARAWLNASQPANLQ